MNNTSVETQSATILIVDDMPENLQLLRELLTAQGYVVRAAPNGERALTFAQATPPDLILLDIKMPGMDGYQVCERLKAEARTRDIPVLFLSALDAVHDKINAFTVGGVDYIAKPFQAKEVLARVNTHLTLRNLQKNLEQKNVQLQQEIDRRTQAEEELRTLNQQLHEANASKDKFFSIIAHDLRSPFTGLIGITEAIIENPDRYTKDQIHTRITRLHTSSENVYALLTNLLTWSRLQQGLMDCVPEEFSLALLVERNVRLLAANADQKQIPLRNLVPKETMAYADPKMVDAVIRNLLSNAVKFTQAGGTIELSVQSHGDVIEVAIADTGIGMDQAQIEKLFRIEVKESRKGTAGEEGTGLGLILCKELVEKNGGKIWVESEVGKGTTFTFTLPQVPLTVAQT